MVDGGRAFDKEGSPKNKIPLKYILMITKTTIEEHGLSDKASYNLLRRALTGRALQSAIQSDNLQTPFGIFFQSLQIMNKAQDDTSALKDQISQLQTVKPRSMAEAMLTIQEINNKLIKEGDNERSRQITVTSVTRNDIFEMIRKHYGFLLAEIKAKDKRLEAAHREELRMIAGSGGSNVLPNTVYHPFHTLFQIVCNAVREHETTRPRPGVQHSLQAQNPPRPKFFSPVHAYQTGNEKTSDPTPQVSAYQNQGAIPKPRNETPRDKEEKCYRCGSTQHFVRDCPIPLPRCNNCNKNGHRLDQCWLIYGKPLDFVPRPRTDRRPPGNPNRNQPQFRSEQDNRRFSGAAPRPQYGELRALEHSPAPPPASTPQTRHEYHSPANAPPSRHEYHLEKEHRD